MYFGTHNAVPRGERFHGCWCAQVYTVYLNMYLVSFILFTPKTQSIDVGEFEQMAL
jgi:hypothetical protein